MMRLFHHRGRGFGSGMGILVCISVILWISTSAVVSQELSDTDAVAVHQTARPKDPNQGFDPFDEFDDDFDFDWDEIVVTTTSTTTGPRPDEVWISSTTTGSSRPSRPLVNSTFVRNTDTQKNVDDHSHSHDANSDSDTEKSNPDQHRIQVDVDKSYAKAKKTVEEGYGPLNVRWAVWVVGTIISIIILVLLFIYCSCIAPDLRSRRGYAFEDARGNHPGEPVPISNNVGTPADSNV